MLRKDPLQYEKVWHVCVLLYIYIQLSIQYIHFHFQDYEEGSQVDESTPQFCILHTTYFILHIRCHKFFYRCDQTFSHESNYNYTHIEPPVRAPEFLSNHQNNIGFSQWTRLVQPLPELPNPQSDDLLALRGHGGLIKSSICVKCKSFLYG